MKTSSIIKFVALGAIALSIAGCKTRSRNIVYGEDTQDTSSFAQKDIDRVVNVAMSNLLKLDRIAVPEGGNRAVIIVENVVNDTSSFGAEAERLSLELGQLIRETLGNSGRVVIYNPEVAKYAAVQVTPQFVLNGRLTQRNVRLDNGDYYKEYALNVQLVEIATGLEYWQKRVPFSKEVDRDRLMY